MLHVQKHILRDARARARVCECVRLCVWEWIHNRTRSRNHIFQWEVCATRFYATRRGHSPSTPMMNVGPLCIRMMGLNQWKQQFPKLILNDCLLTFFVPDNTHAKCRKSWSFTKSAVFESLRHLLPFYLNYLVTKRLEEFSLNTEFSRQFISTFTMHTRSWIYLT